jgi:hypothetical protein
MHVPLTAEEQEKLDYLLGAFDEGSMRAPRVNFLYGLGLVAVAAAMVLLPLVYVSLVVMLGWWVVSAMFLPPVLGDVGGMLKYAALLSLGPIVLFFMVKPWFARPVDRGELIGLEDGQELFLRAFIYMVARSVGSPLPSKIEFDCGVNAAAGFRGGLVSILRNDVRLLIGLPLVAGLNLRSFGGVLAHELGHCSQGFGMRLAFVVQIVNQWLFRVVRGRDSWDLKLRDAAEHGAPHVSVVAWFGIFSVWLIRRFLWTLMVAGQAISCFALRQMEYDADQYEVKFAGANVFRKTSRRLSHLTAGAARAMRLLNQTWQEQKLARDLPMLTRVQTEGLSDRVRAMIDEEMSLARTGWFATHPAAVDRQRAADAIGDDGFYELEDPATVLFRDFEGLCERSTACYYRANWGLEVEDSQLLENDELWAEAEDRKATTQACERYFGGRLTALRPFTLSAEDLELAGADLPGARAKMLEELETRDVEFERYVESETKFVAALQAGGLLMAGYRVDLAHFGLEVGDLAEVMALRKAARLDIDQLKFQLGSFDGIARARLAAGLALARRDASHRHVVDTLVEFLDVYRDLLPMIARLRERWLVQEALLSNARTFGMTGTAEDRLNALVTEMAPMVQQILKATQGRTYPFPHYCGEIALSEFVRLEQPMEKALFMRTYKSTEALLERLIGLYFRVVGRLVLVAEEVEAEEIG